MADLYLINWILAFGCRVFAEINIASTLVAIIIKGFLSTAERLFFVNDAATYLGMSVVAQQYQI